MGRFDHWAIVCQSLFYREVKVLFIFWLCKLNIHGKILRVITKWIKVEPVNSKQKEQQNKETKKIHPQIDNKPQTIQKMARNWKEKESQKQQDQKKKKSGGKKVQIY